VKNYSPVFILVGIFLITFFSCKKINESTELGDGLIPAVDNVTTFDTSMLAITNNIRGIDSIRLTSSDYVAAGHLNDNPEFGTVHANFQFGIAPSTNPGTYPFVHKDSVTNVDSVVLSLSYVGAYGDTGFATQTLRVFEIAQSSGFRYDSSYRYDDPNSEFATTGIELGSKTFQLNKLDDSILFERGKDTFKTAYSVRITLPNSFGQRLINYDTTTSNNGGYRTDSLFRTLFKGFAIKADNGGNVLSYFNLSDISKSKLTIFYKVKKLGGGIDSAASYDFYQTPIRGGFSVPQGKSNYVQFGTAGSNWFNAYNSSTVPDDKLYLQGAPSGSYTSIFFPGLDTFPNKVIHRAELIVTQIPSVNEQIFAPPARIYLDRFRKGTPDTSIVFERDINVGLDGSLSMTSFGGAYKNKGYIFNITRYVQSIVTRHDRNDTLRIYAPFEAQSYVPGLGFVPVAISGVIYNGRVVLAGGNYPDPKTRLRLRIIYSNL
jgi:hypothetical protein